MYLNQNMKLKNGGRKTTDPSYDALKEALFHAYNKWVKVFNEEEGEEAEPLKNINNIEDLWDDGADAEYFYAFMEWLVSGQIIPQVGKDFDKLGFNCGENLFFSPGYECESEIYAGIQSCDIQNGRLHYLGIVSASDGGLGCYGIIYFDGKSLRGYVPLKGNIFNPRTMKMFFYGSMEADDQFLSDLGCDTEDIELDIKSIRADIGARIEFVPGTNPVKKPKVLFMAPHREKQIKTCLHTHEELLHEIIKDKDDFGRPFFEGTEEELESLLTDKKQFAKASLFLYRYIAERIVEFAPCALSSATRCYFEGFHSIVVDGKELHFIGIIGEDGEGALSYAILYASGVYDYYEDHTHTSNPHGGVRGYVPLNGNGYLTREVRYLPKGYIGEIEKPFINRDLLKKVYDVSDFNYDAMFKEIALMTEIVQNPQYKEELQ